MDRWGLRGGFGFRLSGSFSDCVFGVFRFGLLVWSAIWVVVDKPTLTGSVGERVGSVVSSVVGVGVTINNRGVGE